MAEKRSLADLDMEIKKIRIGALAGLFGEEEKQAARELLQQRADVEDPRPEPRTAVPELVRGGVFPIKARLVKLLAFENTPPAVGEVASVPGGTADPTSELPYSGKLTNRLNPDTAALEAIGLAQQVNEWLLTAEEIDMLDWELSQDAITGYPRFLIIYTE